MNRDAIPGNGLNTVGRCITTVCAIILSSILTLARASRHITNCLFTELKALHRSPPKVGATSGIRYFRAGDAWQLASGEASIRQDFRSNLLAFSLVLSRFHPFATWVQMALSYDATRVDVKKIQ